MNYTKVWRHRPKPVEAIRRVGMVGTIHYKPSFPWLGLTANAMVGLGGGVLIVDVAGRVAGRRRSSVPGTPDRGLL